MRQAFFITAGALMPVVGARRIRDAQILSLLTKRMKVEALCISDSLVLPDRPSEVERNFGPHLQLSWHPLDRPNLAVRAANLVRPDFANGYSLSIEHYLRSRAKPGDLVWLSRLRMAKYLAVAKSLGCHTILDEHQVESDLLFDNAFSSIKHWAQGWSAAQCAIYERTLCYRAETVVTTSSIDASRMQKLAPRSIIRVVPHALDTRLYRDGESPPPANQIIFFGDLNYLPHVNGLQWFTDEILPRLRAALRTDSPSVLILSQKRHSGMAEAFPEFKFKTYTTTPELVAHLRESRAVFFPLRYGRGNRVNLLEAMAAGCAVVSTGKGADGLILRPSQELCIADGPDAFTSALVRLMKSPDQREALGTQAQKSARERFDWKNSESAMDHVFDLIGMPSPPSS